MDDAFEKAAKSDNADHEPVEVYTQHSGIGERATHESALEYLMRGNDDPTYKEQWDVGITQQEINDAIKRGDKIHNENGQGIFANDNDNMQDNDQERIAEAKRLDGERRKRDFRNRVGDHARKIMRDFIADGSKQQVQTIKVPISNADANNSNDENSLKNEEPVLKNACGDVLNPETGLPEINWDRYKSFDFSL